MKQNPFRIFAPFRTDFTVDLWRKEDKVNKERNLPTIFAGKRFAIPKQVHGPVTVITRAPMFCTEKADAIATDEMNLTLGILMADCQCFVVYEPKKKIAGLIHAGWKGLIRGVIPAFFTTLKEEWGIKPSQTFVAAGPSLCQQCSQFTDPQQELPGIGKKFFDGRLVDLQGIADDQLEKLGVPSEQRERHPDCTRCHSDTYWSYRGPDRDMILEGWENMLSCRIGGG
ncbi:polyphenol oxidase family protein [Candidatus Peregrinibacteria bacterium]|nr:polyphenol oxidase family protein [Candidatus Peregrinibacteria bacterium]